MTASSKKWKFYKGKTVTTYGGSYKFKNGKRYFRALHECLDTEITCNCWSMLWHGKNGYGGGEVCMKYEAIPNFKKKVINIYNKFAENNFATMKNLLSLSLTNLFSSWNISLPLPILTRFFFAFYNYILSCYLFCCFSLLDDAVGSHGVRGSCLPTW